MSKGIEIQDQTTYKLKQNFDKNKLEKNTTKKRRKNINIENLSMAFWTGVLVEVEWCHCYVTRKCRQKRSMVEVSALLFFTVEYTCVNVKRIEFHIGKM
jgi:hypothetical protein